MGKQTPNSGGRSDQSAPGKPASRQPPDANTGKSPGKDKDPDTNLNPNQNQHREEGQDIPKTG